MVVDVDDDEVDLLLRWRALRELVLLHDNARRLLLVRVSLLVADFDLFVADLDLHLLRLDLAADLDQVLRRVGLPRLDGGLVVGDDGVRPEQLELFVVLDFVCVAVA